MGSDEDGVPRRVIEGSQPNVFALVIYIPDPLGMFLDDLRRELVPGCNPHAHVSVLPPRNLEGDWRIAAEQVRALAGSWPPFDIELTQIEVFPRTNVVYLEVGAGGRELREMHAAINYGALECSETFVYHPHITLAQGVPHDSVSDLRALASRRWNEFRGSRVFRAERAVFVQNLVDNVWVDLANYDLGTMAIR
jgi:2'-5' RNA ligase